MEGREYVILTLSRFESEDSKIQLKVSDKISHAETTIHSTLPLTGKSLVRAATYHEKILIHSAHRFEQITPISLESFTVRLRHKPNGSKFGGGVTKKPSHIPDCCRLAPFLMTGTATTL